MRLVEFREAKNLTPSQLAKKAGLSTTYIKLLESGKKSPTLRTLEKLASALNISVSELLGEDKPTGTEGE